MDSMVGTTLTIERELGLKVETLKKSLYVSSPLGDENRDDMSGLRVGDLKDSTHSGPEDHGHVRVRCDPGDGLADSLQSPYQL